MLSVYYVDTSRYPHTEHNLSSAYHASKNTPHPYIEHMNFFACHVGKNTEANTFDKLIWSFCVDIVPLVCICCNYFYSCDAYKFDPLHTGHNIFSFSCVHTKCEGSSACIRIWTDHAGRNNAGSSVCIFLLFCCEGISDKSSCLRLLDQRLRVNSAWDFVHGPDKSLYTVINKKTLFISFTPFSTPFVSHPLVYTGTTVCIVTNTGFCHIQYFLNEAGTWKDSVCMSTLRGCVWNFWMTKCIRYETIPYTLVYRISIWWPLQRLSWYIKSELNSTPE